MTQNGNEVRMNHVEELHFGIPEDSTRFMIYQKECFDMLSQISWQISSIMSSNMGVQSLHLLGSGFRGYGSNFSCF